jgi:hypothetical protein
MKATNWTRLGTCYTLITATRTAQIYKLKHSMLPPLYHCHIMEEFEEIDYFVERTLREAKAACGEKVRTACD